MVLLAPFSGLLGAPGVFSEAPTAVRELTGVRRDVTAFLGVAPRGPARLPPETLEPDDDMALWLTTAPVRRSVPQVVTSWDEYRYHFGGFEGPGRLPYAAWAFFAGGGRRAWVVRILHEHEPAGTVIEGRAHGVLGALETTPTTGGAPIRLFARNEGRWGDGLRATLRFATRPLGFEADGASALLVDEHEWVPSGTLIRSFHTGDVRVLRYVDRSEREPEPLSAGFRRRLTLDAPLPANASTVEIVTASLEVIEADPSFARREVIDDLGLRADHPRWLARRLIVESRLLWPDAAWVGGTVDREGPGLAGASLGDVVLVAEGAGPGDTVELHMTGGQDRWSDIVPSDFWDAAWVPGTDPTAAEVWLDGVQALAGIDEIGLIAAPDLYSPEPIAPLDDVRDEISLCGPEFDYHVGESEAAQPDPAPQVLTGLELIPTIPDDLEQIVAAQQQLVQWVETGRDATLLLDAPLGLAHRQLVTWRANFDSPHVAAYHPWLDASTPDDGREALIRLNPSSFAAAIIAERELRLGVQFGPANELARGAVRVAELVDGRRHDELHMAGVNVFVPERDGIRLTGARTLSRRRTLRQLSVVRLMTVLRLSLQREMQWAVFEPNSQALWAEVRRVVHGFLSRLFEAGAFTGASTKEAFFVRCDRTTMTSHDIDNGRLICLVGVAPAEPIEYIVLQIALSSTGSVAVEVQG